MGLGVPQFEETAAEKKHQVDQENVVVQWRSKSGG